MINRICNISMYVCDSYQLSTPGIVWRRINHRLCIFISRCVPIFSTGLLLWSLGVIRPSGKYLCLWWYRDIFINMALDLIFFEWSILRMVVSAKNSAAGYSHHHQTPSHTSVLISESSARKSFKRSILISWQVLMIMMMITIKVIAINYDDDEMFEWCDNQSSHSDFTMSLPLHCTWVGGWGVCLELKCSISF